MIEPERLKGAPAARGGQKSPTSFPEREAGK